MKSLAPKIGMRTFKTFLAVLISALLMQYAFHESPFFACIGAVVAVERTMTDSFHAALVRNVGTITGGVLGIVFSYITQNTALLCLGVIPLIYIKNIIDRKDSIVAGAIVYFAVVFLNIGGNATEYGIRRIIGTLFGTFIGILVNYFIFPPRTDVTESNYGIKP